METKKRVVKVVTATEAKNRFGAYIKEVYLGTGHVIVKRGDIPVVAIVPMADYEQLMDAEEMPAEIETALAASAKEARARERLRAFLDRVQSELPEIREEQAAEEIAEAISAVRKSP